MTKSDELEMIQRKLHARWPALQIRLNKAEQVLGIYGFSPQVDEPMAEAERLASDSNIEVEQLERVECSRSGGFGTVGELKTLPQVVKQDSRGVALFCEKEHVHDWDDYEPLLPLIA